MDQINDIDFSYFAMRLLLNLKDSHPHRIHDREFIDERSSAALEAYVKAISEGEHSDVAHEIADDVLCEGLDFSLHDLIVDVLWDEFTYVVPPSIADRVAIRLYPYLDCLTYKYDTTDDFTYSEEYMKLYTELVGAIAIKLEELYGI